MMRILTISALFGLLALGCSSARTETAGKDRSLAEQVLGAGLGDDAEDWVAECMANAGFGDMVTQGSDLTLAAAPDGSEETWVKEHGYGILEIVIAQADSTPDALTEQVAAMDPSTAEAFTTAHTSCMDQYIDERDHEPVSQHVRDAYVHMIREEIVADEQYLAIEQQWVNCMKSHGFDYRDQNEPKHYFSDVAANAPDYDLAELAVEFEEEKRIALQDFRCREPLADQFDALVSEYEAHFEQTYANELTNQ